MRKLFFLIALFTAIPAVAQVPVALSPVAKQQFFDTTGTPLAGGALFTFIAGTTTQQPTYTESTGTVAYPNPIILDSGGFVPGPLFLIGNGYKFVLCTAFTGASGTGTCSAFGPQQWTIDNILLPPFLGGNNTFTGTNTFNGATIFNGTVTMNAGGSLNGTFSGSPTFSGAINFTGGPTFSGVSPVFTVVPLFNAGLGSGLSIPTPSIGTTPITQSFTNDGVTGTTLNKLVKISGGNVINATVNDVSGIIGICVSGCGIGGTSQIAIIGRFSCIFDSSTAAGDYVQPSSGTAGDCHDFGSSPPPTQVVGRVTSTNIGGGTYPLQLFGAEDVNNVQFCGTTAGSANAQTLTPTMPLSAYFVGFSCRAVAGFTNTTATTLAVSGLAPISLRKKTAGGLAPFTGGEFFLGEQFEVVYDGTFFQLASEPAGSADQISTIRLKKGNNVSNYVAATGAFAAVDATNLALTITIPIGDNLVVSSAGTMSPTGGTSTWYVALFDGASKLTEQSLSWTAGGASNACPGGQNCGNQNFNLNYMIVGDGASHNIQLEYAVEGLSNDTTGRILNSGGIFPTMTFIMSPSN